MSDSPPTFAQLLTQERFLRRLAGSVLDDAHGAEDLVQETWLRAAVHGPRSQRGIRAWLAKALRSVASNRRIEDSRRLQRERAVAQPEALSSVSDILELEQRRRDLVDAVLRLGAVLREVVLLRFYDDLPPREIGKRLGLSSVVVRDRLRRGLSELRAALRKRGYGDLRALAPLVGMPAWSAQLSVMTLGGLGMNMKKALVALGLSVLIVSLGTIILVSEADPSPPTPPGPPLLQAEVDVTSEDSARSEEDALRERIASDSGEASTAATATSGSLLVQAVYGDDGSPAADLEVRVREPANTGKAERWRRARTDAKGEARIARLPPGEVMVITPPRDVNVASFINAGEESEATVALEGGIDISGIVMNTSNVPVAGATITLGLLAMGETDSEGRFLLRQAPLGSLFVGARARGYTPSPLKLIRANSRQRVDDVRIVLPSPGGSIHGKILDPDGKPVENASVRFGERDFIENIKLSDGTPGALPLLAVVRTDELGEFVCEGLEPGDMPVTVVTEQLAPWEGVVEVVAHVAVPLIVQLTNGVTVEGIAQDLDGNPMGGVEVRYPDNGSLRTAPDGSYRIEGLPVGRIAVKMNASSEYGTAATELYGAAGDVLRWDTTLTPELKLPEFRPGLTRDARGFVVPAVPPTARIVGRVVDPDGRPLGNARILVHLDTEPIGGIASDADGGIDLDELPPGEYQVRVKSGTYATFASKPHRLENGQTWNLGTVQLTRGGQLRSPRDPQ